jgi:CheY-like chemotaxis protein
MPRVDGLQILEASRRFDPDRPVIMMTAFSEVETAIESIRRGAYHYLTKPFRLEELSVFVDRALADLRLKREAAHLRRELQDGAGINRLIGDSQAMRSVRELIRRLAATSAPVLILGETGTGSLPSGQTVALVAHALEAQGQLTELAEAHTGVVLTAWTDTGYTLNQPAFEDNIGMTPGRLRRSHDHLPAAPVGPRRTRSTASVCTRHAFGRDAPICRFQGVAVNAVRIPCRWFGRHVGWQVVCAPAVLIAIGCTHPQRPQPYSFVGSLPAEKTTEILARALETSGQVLEIADARAGVLLTAWTNSGYHFHEPPFEDASDLDQETDVYRRYHLAISQPDAPGSTTVRLEVEAKRCRPGVQVTRRELFGICEGIENVFPGLQRDLDRLGTQIQQAVNAPASVGTVERRATAAR